MSPPHFIKSLGQFWRSKVLRFGVYDKVYPEEVTECRTVPDNIAKPTYVQEIEFDFSKETYIKNPELKNDIQIVGMRKSCKLAASLLEKVEYFVKEGITTDEIDEHVHKMTIDAGAYPSPLNYKGFPKSICTSVNNVAVHGIPDLRPLKNGDIVNVDITVYLNGFHGDCSKTFLVGNVDDRGVQLVTVTEECLKLAIEACGPDVPLSNIGYIIHRHAKQHGLTVLPSILGHGIGDYFHGPPDIYHTRNRYPGFMKKGMTFTIEPALSHGSEHTCILEDGWTVITEDGSRVAQAEHTVLINDDGAEILTY